MDFNSEKIDFQERSPGFMPGFFYTKDFKLMTF